MIITFVAIGAAIAGLTWLVLNLDRFGPGQGTDRQSEAIPLPQMPADAIPLPDTPYTASFREALTEVLLVGPEQVYCSATLASIDADWLDIIECVMILEDTFDIEITEEELEAQLGDASANPDLKPDATVGDLWELVLTKLPVTPVHPH